MSETLRILTVQPCVITSRANQQVAVAIVRTIAVDVMYMFASFQRATKHAFRDLHVYGLRACTAVRFQETTGAVAVAAYASAFMCLALCDVAADFAAREIDHLQLAAVWTGIQWLSEFVAWKADKLGPRIPSVLTFVKARLEADRQQMGALSFRHYVGILHQEHGIA